ncbi:MAG: hypothetical protein R3360_01020 [Alphaproteobacteria bacterium]|nr:hypothetical protein [Alphaproteobacteria bacterium]
MRPSAVLLALAAVMAAWALPVHAQPSGNDNTTCFGPDNIWCAYPVSPGTAPIEWGVAHRQLSESGYVVHILMGLHEGSVDFGALISPVKAGEWARVILSVREPNDRMGDWPQFTAGAFAVGRGNAFFRFSRPALEALLEADDDAHLYLFLESGPRGQMDKAVHKVSLRGFHRALRFARLGGE